MDELDMDNFDLSEFLATKSDSDSDLEEFTPKKRSRTDILTEKVKEVCTLQTKNKLTFAASSKVCHLMNGMPNTTVKIPVDHRTRKTLAEKKFDYNIFVICDKCDELNPNQSVCACGQSSSMDSKKNNFLVHFPLEIQLRSKQRLSFNISIANTNMVKLVISMMGNYTKKSVKIIQTYICCQLR